MAIRNRFKNKLFIILIILLAFLFVLPESKSLVKAHSSLQKTYPQNGESLDKPPSKIELWFEDPVVVHSESIKVTSETGTEFQRGKPFVEPKIPGILSFFWKAIFNPASIPYILM
jgi:copper transport protein